MKILDKLFGRTVRTNPTCIECANKLKEIQEEHTFQQERIKKMHEELIATMNGEESWFLTKRKKGEP